MGSLTKPRIMVGRYVQTERSLERRVQRLASARRHEPRVTDTGYVMINPPIIIHFPTQYREIPEGLKEALKDQVFGFYAETCHDSDEHHEFVYKPLTRTETSILLREMYLG